jgi:hypothetical protein
VRLRDLPLWLGGLLLALWTAVRINSIRWENAVARELQRIRALLEKLLGDRRDPP